MSARTLPPDVEAVLNRGDLNFQPPLRVAWGWNRSGNRDDLAKADLLLAELAEPERFAFALPVWYERAFNLVRRKQPDDALALLNQIGRQFATTLDEDTLSLWGRIFKDRGDAALAAGNLPLAESEYRDAEDRYRRAYLLHHDRFPGINVATLQFVRASLIKFIAESAFQESSDPTADRQSTAATASSELLESARATARELVAARETWKDNLPDDAIWRLATLAEAYVLLEKWVEAKAAYRAALASPNEPQPYHSESMRAQLNRLFAAYARLGKKDLKVDDFVPPPALVA